MKRKLVVALVAIVGVSVLLRLRGDDTEPNDAEEDPTEEVADEPTSTETTPSESETTTSESTSSEGATGTEPSGKRELDMFDMLAIFAAAVTSAREEYRKRTGM